MTPAEALEFARWDELRCAADMAEAMRLLNLAIEIYDTAQARVEFWERRAAESERRVAA